MAGADLSDPTFDLGTVGPVGRGEPQDLLEVRPCARLVAGEPPHRPALVVHVEDTWTEADRGVAVGERHAKGLCVEPQLTSLMRAFEGLFDERHGKTARHMRRAQFDRHAEPLPCQVPADTPAEPVQSRRGAIAGAIRWVLAERLRHEMAGWRGTLIEGYFEDSERFVQVVKPLRDKLAHGADLGGVESYSGDMVDAVERLRVLVTAMLLHRLGLPRDGDGERIATHPAMYHLRGRNAGR